jgi:hypothetical protein
MKTIARPITLGLLLAICLHAAPAGATGYFSTWISTRGDDTNDCGSAEVPCRTVQGAYGKTTNGGSIYCADSGHFTGDSGFNIDKSIVIDCRGHIAHFAGIVVDISNASAVVVLRGLTLDGSFNNPQGVWFKQGGQLHIENCRVTGFTFGFASGIRFAPSDGSRLSVVDSVISVNGSANNTGGGIIIRPTGSGSARVALSRVNVENNVFGVAVDGTDSTAGINVTISDSTMSGNLQDGIIAVTPGGGAPIGVMVKNTRSANNQIGIRSLGPNVTVRVDGSTVIGNGTGLAFGSGGALLTYGNNNVDANGSDGAFSGPVTLK